MLQPYQLVYAMDVQLVAKKKSAVEGRDAECLGGQRYRSNNTTVAVGGASPRERGDLEEAEESLGNSAEARGVVLSEEQTAHDRKHIDDQRQEHADVQHALHPLRVARGEQRKEVRAQKRWWTVACARPPLSTPRPW